MAAKKLYDVYKDGLMIGECLTIEEVIELTGCEAKSVMAHVRKYKPLGGYELEITDDVANKRLCDAVSGMARRILLVREDIGFKKA